MSARVPRTGSGKATLPAAESPRALAPGDGCHWTCLVDDLFFAVGRGRRAVGLALSSDSGFRIPDERRASWREHLFPEAARVPWEIAWPGRWHFTRFSSVLGRGPASSVPGIFFGKDPSFRSRGGRWSAVWLVPDVPGFLKPAGSSGATEKQDPPVAAGDRAVPRGYRSGDGFPPTLSRRRGHWRSSLAGQDSPSSRRTTIQNIWAVRGFMESIAGPSAPLPSCRARSRTFGRLQGRSASRRARCKSAPPRWKAKNQEWLRHRPSCRAS